MGRYIDADELHNQGWVAARYKNWEPTPLNDNFRLEVEVKPFITFSAADVVAVVRCRDCKHFDKWHTEVNGDTGYYCTRPNQQTCNLLPEDYCSYGEKR